MNIVTTLIVLLWSKVNFMLFASLKNLVKDTFAYINWEEQCTKLRNGNRDLKIFVFPYSCLSLAFSLQMHVLVSLSALHHSAVWLGML